MSATPHLPVLRAGREYVSLDTIELRDHRQGETSDPIATVSQVNSGVIRRDMKLAAARAAVLREVPVA